MEEQRRVWICNLPNEAQILVEMFGDGPMTLAFRENHHLTWGPPHPAVEMP